MIDPHVVYAKHDPVDADKQALKDEERVRHDSDPSVEDRFAIVVKFIGVERDVGVEEDLVEEGILPR